MSHLDRIATLTTKARRRAWTADQLDWSVDLVLPDGLRPAVYVDMVSQLHHAELVALDALARTHAELPAPEARAFLATQIVDEERHAEVYRTYLARLGDLRPIDPGLAEAFAAARAWRGPAWALVVSLNVIMEHEALHQQHRRIATLPCPLFKQINQRIVADESRHAAFGILYLEHALPQVPADEKSEVLAWLRQLWTLWNAANRGRYHTDGEAVLRVDADELERRGRRVGAMLVDLGLATDDRALT